MTDSRYVSRAGRRHADDEASMEVELTKGSASIMPSGGLGMGVGPNFGDAAHRSASNHRPIAPGGVVFVASILSNEGLKHIDFVDYIDANGTAHALGDRLSIGWLGCELKRGAAVADV